MRGEERRSGSLFSYVDLEARVAPRHPLRLIRRIVDDVLARLDRDFAALYSPLGRRSIPPEFLLRALLLQAFYSIRSERQLMEQLDYNLLFRWFVGLGVDDPVWDASSYAKNRDRLLAGDVAAKVLAGVTEHPEVRPLLSDEHFTVDGTLIEAWASLKSFRRRDGSGEPPPSGRNAEQDFHGERRRNDTHASTTDPQAKLLRKGPGREARLCFMGHLLGENRHGLVVQAAATQASGRAEPETALALVGDLPGRHRITVGADKAFDTAGFVTGLRGLNATPHVAQCITAVRGSRIDGRTTRHPGYQQRQRRRKLIGEAFGWIKLIAGQRKSRFRGTDRVGWAFTFAAAGRLGLHLRRSRLQPGPDPQVAGGSAMTAPADCQLIGRWRITEADLWDRDYLDLGEPAHVTIGEDGRGEFAFGAVQAGMDIEYARRSVFFTWAGFDEMDEVSGSGSAELDDDGTLEIELSFHLGDEALLKARRA